MREINKDILKGIAFEEIRHIINEAYKNNTDRKYGVVTESDANQIVGVVKLATSLINYIDTPINTEENANA